MLVERWKSPSLVCCLSSANNSRAARRVLTTHNAAEWSDRRPINIAWPTCCQFIVSVVLSGQDNSTRFSRLKRSSVGGIISAAWSRSSSFNSSWSKAGCVAVQSTTVQLISSTSCFNIAQVGATRRWGKRLAFVEHHDATGDVVQFPGSATAYWRKGFHRTGRWS